MNIFKELVISIIESKADTLLSSGKARKIKQAIRLYNKIIKIVDTKANIYWNKMIGYIILKEFDQALLCVDRLIGLEPNNAKFYNEKASLLCSSNLQRYEEAIDYYNTSIEIQNDYSDAYFGKGIALASLHKYDQAEVCYNKVLELAPENFDIYPNQAIVYLKRKMYKKALELCDKSIELSYQTKSSLDFAYFTKSRIYAMMNLKDECINNLCKAIKINNSFKDYVPKCEEFDNVKDDKDFISVLSKFNSRSKCGR
ncbi:tetratricopeptide repeat protein [Clostridium beijerinckii]|uniref:tetratricopeptide repeat protein n=1 Tax=Clostridium beijerinckii TaxID=1520 RepID=UPI002227F838|nr:tetratricopeptide repeat protein [Clostridium beijerinckii]UYZ38020.1 tetratricopeptide repeat protein [Clostridium beijerinckii]